MREKLGERRKIEGGPGEAFEVGRMEDEERAMGSEEKDGESDGGDGRER